MFDRVKKILAVPSFADEENARLTRLLSHILALFLVVSIPLLIWQGMVFSRMPMTLYKVLDVLIIGVIVLTSLISIFLIRRGHVTSTGALLSSVIWLVATVWVCGISGIRDVSVTGYFLVVFISGLVLGGRTTIAFGLLCIASISLSFYFQTSGYLDVAAEARFLDFAILTAALTITVLLLRFSTRIVGDAFRRARRNEQALVEINRMLEEEIVERRQAEAALQEAYEAIEERVQARTVALNQEIAERQQIQEALWESEKRFRAIAETASDGIIIFDADEHIFFWNEAARKLFCYASGETQGKPIASILSGRFLDVLRSAVGQVLTNGHSDLIGRTLGGVGTRRDGTEFPIELSLSTWETRAGTFFTVIARDVTERRQTEQALRQAYEEIEKRVEERTEALELEIAERKRAEADLERLLADLKYRSRQLQTAAEVSRAVSSILDPSDLIRQVVDLVRERFDLYYVGLFLIDQSGEWTGEPGKWAVLRAGTGEGGQKLMAKTHSLEIGGRSLVGRCIATMEACVALDISEETVCFKNPVLPETRSSLALPLISRGEAIGALTIQSNQTGAFSEEDMVVFRVMADQLANAIQNAYLFEDVRVRSGRLTVLNYIARAVSAATLQIDELLNVVYQEISAVFEADAFCIAFYNEASDALDFRLLVDEGIVEPRYQEPLGNGFLSYVVGERKPLLVRNYEREAEDLPTPQLFGTMKHPPSWLGVPMFSGDKVIGAISVQAYRPYAWGEDDQLLLATISDEITAAVRNARLFEQAQLEIQERKRAEEALRLTQFSLDRAADTVFWMGPDTRFVYANDAACRSLGYSRDELYTMFLHDIDPNYPPDVWPDDWQAIKENGASMTESCHRTKDGHLIPVEVTVNYLEFGGQEYYCAFVRNISERKQAEEALRENERRYRQAIERSPNPIFSTDREGVIQSWNRACERVFKYGPEIVGQHYGQLLLNSEDQPAIEAWLERVFSRQDLADLDMYYRCQDGTERFTISRLYPLIDDEGDVYSCVFTNTDITERIRAEMALIESEERYRTLLNQAPIGIMTCDRQGNIGHINPAAVAILALDEAPHVQTCNLFTSMPNLIEAGIIEDFRLCIEQGTQIMVERRCLTYGGREHILRLHLTPLGDEAGGIRGMLAIVEDVTEQRQLEEKLIQSAKLASIGELAAGVAHEINNPLNGIINYAQLLINKAEPESQQACFLHGILREGDRVVEIVRDLLTFARMEKDTRYSFTHIHEILQSTLTLSHKQLEKDGIQLAIDEAPDVPRIKCRGQRIQQVFLNLISNARDALNARYPQGHKNKCLTIRIESLEKKDGLWVRTVFRDHGVGMAEQDHPYIFTPFFTTKRPGEGTGLGLSVSYGIIQDHRGDIWFESAEGEHTTFYVDLPVDPELA